MNEKLQKLYDMAVKELTGNILPWWMTYAVDEENGGFYGEVDNDNKPVAHAPKFITLNARLIWTFASAYRVLGDEKYRKMADRAYDYFVQHFWDAEHNACNTYVDEFGNPTDKHRYIYGNAFAVYGFSEYARATGSKEALEYAQKLVASLEKYVYDPVYKGYFESCKEDWTVDPWTRGVNRLPSDQKTMNTHLHMIEAYTCLLRTDKSKFMQNKVREHLYVMLNKIVDHDIHHYYYFQDRAWNPTTQEISFGHDIEGSWLMMETAEVLGEPEAMRYAQDTCMNIARACYEQGFREDGAMLSEYDPVTGHASQRLSWWEQNEAVVGFLNAWEVTGEEKYLDASLQCFDFADKHFVDHEKGGWFAVLSLDGTQVLSKQKANGPTCPYHNGRMCMEIIERYRRHAAAEGAKTE